MEGSHLFRRILVAVDGSAASMRAMEHAARLAKHEGSELTALHVIPRPALHISVEGSGEAGVDLAAYYDRARREAKKWLREMEVIAARHGVGLRSEILVDASSVLDAILGYAERYSVDLVVTGTRGRTPSARILMGSVAHGLVQYASCPVLVVR